MMLRAKSDARVMLLGGEAFKTSRHVWWNFVSSSRERINQAKDDWKTGAFPKVPGDEEEFIPIPEVPLKRSEKSGLIAQDLDPKAFQRRAQIAVHAHGRDMHLFPICQNQISRRAAVQIAVNFH
jgi:hypothetical protein